MVRIPTVDGRNPANQLRLVVYPIIYKVLYIPSGWPWDFSHQQYVFEVVATQVP